MTAKAERAMAEIEGEIARRRAELGHTLDALAVELAPRRLVEKGVDMITEHVRANRPEGISLGGALRADPVPLALIGLGIAWLAAENIGLLPGMAQDRPAVDAADRVMSAREIEHRGAEPARAMPRSGGGNRWAHQATGAAQGALRSICAGADAVIDHVGGYIGGAAHPRANGEAAGHGLIAGAERNPLLLGAVGLVAGAVLAMLLPASRREHEIAARAREDLWDEAEALGRRATDCVRGMAESSSGPTASSHGGTGADR